MAEKKDLIGRRGFLGTIAALAQSSSVLWGAERGVPGPPVVYPNEPEAIAEGRRLGIGSARMEGPKKTAETGSYQTFTVVYTAGKAGMKPGGGIRIGQRHVYSGGVPQTKNPKAPNYLRVETTSRVPTKVSIHHVYYDSKGNYTTMIRKATTLRCSSCTTLGTTSCRSSCPSEAWPRVRRSV